MNKKITLISSVLAVSISSVCVAANAMPLVGVDQCVGLLGGPIAQLPINDPQVEQAIDVLKAKQLQLNNQRKLPTNPETTISRARRNQDRVLILGGPENIPM